MELLLPRLHASAAEPLPFGPSLEVRAFLLQREQGNLLLYRSAALADERDAVEKLVHCLKNGFTASDLGEDRVG